VKVLDFGLAKALDDESGSGVGDASLSPTMTSAATRAGVVMGTAAYMSPEQAKGKPVDRRADIWSFGVVLFEILTRRSTFEGETVSDTLASVLKVDPDWSALPAGTPAPVADLLHRCLEKDPKQRLQSIGEARIAIQAALRGPGATAISGAAAMVPGEAVEAKRVPGAAVWLAGMVVVAAVAGAVGYLLKPASAEGPPRRFDISWDELSVQYRRTPAISPDGRRIAFIADNRLWIRDLETLQPREIPDSEGARVPFWSPDSASLGFTTKGKLLRVAATGGQPTVIAELNFGRLDGGTWGLEDTLYITPRSGAMHTVSAQGGDPRLFIEPEEDKETDFHTPHALPGGQGILYTVHRAEGPDTIEVFAGGERKVVMRIEGDRIENAVWSATGHLIYGRRTKNPGIWAVPFSLSTLATTGEPILLAPEGTNPSVSGDGTLIYATGAGTGEGQLAWVDRTGQIRGTIGQPQGGMIFPELSPDGRKVLVSADQGDNRDIWIHDVERGTRTRLTFGDEADWSGTWFPSGDRIVFTSGAGTNNKTFSRLADGTDEPVPYLDGYLPSFRQGVPEVAFDQRQTESGQDIFHRPLEGDGEAVPFLVAPGDQGDSQISRDGRYLAYVSDESGRNEVYLTGFPSGQGKWQVSVEGGSWPRWSRKKDELFFIEAGAGISLMSVKVTTRPSLQLSTPEKLFDDTTAPGVIVTAGLRQYDTAPDGETFLVVQPAGADRDAETRLVVTENWLAAHGKAGKR
jgi:Tol biopolymer transport system component